MSKMTVLVVEPGMKPYVKEIDDTLESLQHEVDGYIQAIYPFEEEIALIVDEESKLKSAPLNRSLRDENGEIYDIIAGKFLIVGLTEDNFGSLSEEQIKHFSKLFITPEMFVNIGGKIFALPCE